MPVSRKRKDRGKGAGARERRRRNAQHNEAVRERMREFLGVAPGRPDLQAAAALLLPALVHRAGKLR